MAQHVHLDGIPPLPDDGPFNLHLTDAAAKMAKALMAKQGENAAFLKVSVTGGGCSGMQYHLTFAGTGAPGDLTLQKGDVVVLVDPESQQYLNGVTIDYVHALTGAGFKFLNPNAERTCGCGSSFNVA